MVYKSIKQITIQKKLFSHAISPIIFFFSTQNFYIFNNDLFSNNLTKLQAIDSYLKQQYYFSRYFFSLFLITFPSCQISKEFANLLLYISSLWLDKLSLTVAIKLHYVFCTQIYINQFYANERIVY